MDENLIEAIRAQYQADMKYTFAKIGIEVKNPTKNSVEEIKSLVNLFSRTKEDASYFEAIVKNLKGEDTDE